VEEVNYASTSIRHTDTISRVHSIHAHTYTETTQHISYMSTTLA